MMTLLPMAAFAAPANRTFSIVTADTDVVTADGDDEVTFTVFLRDGDRDPAVGEYVYVASDRGLGFDTVVDKITEVKGATEAASGEDNVVALKVTDESGKVEIKVSSEAAGEATFVFATKAQYNDEVTLFDRANGDRSVSDANLGVIKVETVTFEASGDAEIEVSNVTAKKDNKTVDVTADDEKVVTYTADVPANGLDYYEIEVNVNSNKNPVANADVTFSANKSDVEFSKKTVTTNAAGYAKVKVYATKNGTYDITARAEGESQKFKLVFGTLGFSNLQVVSGKDDVVALDEEWDFTLKLVDKNGNQVKLNDSNVKAEYDKIIWDVMTKPSNARLEAKSFDSVVTYKADDDNLKVTLGKTLLNKEGNYNIRARIGTNYVEIPFKVQKQGDIVELTLSYKQDAIGINGQTSAPTIKLLDAEGVAKKVDREDADLTWTISNSRIATIDNGIVKGAGDDDYTGPVTVTVIHTDENLSATARINVTLEPAAFDVEVQNAAVNEEAVITLNLKDVDGQNVAFGDNYENIKVDAYVISKPADADVTTTISSTGVAKSLKETGKATVKVESSEEGKVVLQLVLSANLKDGEKEKVTFSKAATVEFGKAATEKPGAGKVTLFIGQQVAVVDGNASVLDVAPFIKDGRTFVPVRFIAEALGADVKYDAATQTVTATRGDDVVVLTIGSNVMTVNGEAQVTDVAPFIVDGRTVLPFRALAEAFGSEVTWDAATQSVVFEK